MWIVIGLIIGMSLGLLSNIIIPVEYSKYVAMAILACLDSVVGATLATMQKTFDIRIFFSGFFANALTAAVLTYIGSLLNVDLGLAATIVFGTRLFTNFATIRRLFFNRIKLEKEENKTISQEN